MPYVAFDELKKIEELNKKNVSQKKNPDKHVTERHTKHTQSPKEICK